MYMSTDAGLEA